MKKNPPYTLLLDSNIWVSDRLLKTALGAATLHVLTKSGARIIVPEIVELEVDRILLAQAEKAAETIQQQSRFLGQISGQKMQIMAPSQIAIKAAIDNRWAELSGIIDRIPFTFTHARAALNRILKGTPPCGPNNEQFRDCCIWECAIEKAAHSPVRLISCDNAFYEGRNKSGEMSNSLTLELKELNREIKIYPSLDSFLNTIEGESTKVDDEAIKNAIADAIVPEARNLAFNKGKKSELGKLQKMQITGYATPKDSVIAVSFNAFFDIIRFDGDADSQPVADRMRIAGGCSYDPANKSVSEIEVSEWTISIKGYGSKGFSAHSYSSAAWDRQFFEKNYRIL